MPLLDWIAACWGFAALFVLGLSVATARKLGSSHAGWLALVLCASWLASKLIAASWGWPVAWASYPFIDCLVGLATLGLWIARPAWWKAALALVCIAKLTAHIANAGFVAAALAGKHVPGGHDYILICNVLYGFELGVVAMPGGHIVANRVLDLLFPHPRQRVRAVPRARRGSAR